MFSLIMSTTTYLPIYVHKIKTVIGISKNIRLYSNASDNYQLGCSFAGSIFYPFISWLLDNTKKRNIDRLYFVARDGYVLKHCMDILIREKKSNIKTLKLQDITVIMIGMIMIGMLMNMELFISNATV